MTNTELVQKLYRMAKVSFFNNQENMLIRQAAETIEELDERVSIMMEGCNITEEKYQQMVIERMERI
ncbi:MAG: hypothetical protein IKP40_13975 [Clostridia bacterium]|nr:hypothetical protein [Clostridia bacterium]